MRIAYFCSAQNDTQNHTPKTQQQHKLANERKKKKNEPLQCFYVRSEKRNAVVTHTRTLGHSNRELILKL